MHSLDAMGSSREQIRYLLQVVREKFGGDSRAAHGVGLEHEDEEMEQVGFN